MSQMPGVCLRSGDFGVSHEVDCGTTLNVGVGLVPVFDDIPALGGRFTRFLDGYDIPHATGPYTRMTWHFSSRLVER